MLNIEKRIHAELDYFHETLNDEDWKRFSFTFYLMLLAEDSNEEILEWCLRMKEDY